MLDLGQDGRGGCGRAGEYIAENRPAGVGAEPQHVLGGGGPGDQGRPAGGQEPQEELQEEPQEEPQEELKEPGEKSRRNFHRHIA